MQPSRSLFLPGRSIVLIKSANFNVLSNPYVLNAFLLKIKYLFTRSFCVCFLARAGEKERALAIRGEWKPLPLI